ncbi:MAG: response regulator transcription factor [Paracoccaceae bacterium]|nr:response regulator transcription factor [Paracoccaceae bacterium]MDE2912851.1 response regulator transcription factor [Paracoccaceae bacterium]
MVRQPRPHVLLVDDDQRIRDLLKKYLARNGYRVSAARDADHAFGLIGGLVFDLIVLDVMMPGEDGITLTARLRDAGIPTPILMLTARSESSQRVMGFEAGADDYLGKPFEPRELILRMAAILRRIPEPEDGEEEPPRMLQLGDCRYDVMRGELWKRDTYVRLTATETQLMRILSSQPRQAVSRAELVEALGRSGGKTQTRAVDVQITRLRRKLETEPRSPRYLQTVRKAGYALVPD